MLIQTDVNFMLNAYSFQIRMNINLNNLLPATIINRKYSNLNLYIGTYTFDVHILECLAVIQNFLCSKYYQLELKRFVQTKLHRAGGENVYS